MMGNSSLIWVGVAGFERAASSSRSQVHSRSVLSISAQGTTAAQAEGTANAVADTYVAYVASSRSAAGTVQARLLSPATNTSGTSLPSRLLVPGGLGILLGLLIGAFGVIVLSRSDRRSQAK